MTENINSKYLILPCCGIEKLTGQLSGLIASAWNELSVIENCILQSSLPQIVANVEKAQDQAKTCHIIAINGCSQQCVSKILNQLKMKSLFSAILPSLLKNHGYSPQDPKKLSEEDLKLVPLIAQDLEMQLTNLLFPSENSSEYTLSEFNPLFEDQLEYQQSKFKFRVPIKDVDFYFTWNDSWAYIQDGKVIVGISDYMQKSIGDIVTIELPEINHHIDQLDSVATIEATKTVVEVLAPFSGTIVAINSGLQNEPERINQSPYQMGWICVIAPSDT